MFNVPFSAMKRPKTASKKGRCIIVGNNSKGRVHITASESSPKPTAEESIRLLAQNHAGDKKGVEVLHVARHIGERNVCW